MTVVGTPRECSDVTCITDCPSVQVEMVASVAPVPQAYLASQGVTDCLEVVVCPGTPRKATEESQVRINTGKSVGLPSTNSGNSNIKVTHGCSVHVCSYINYQDLDQFSLLVQIQL